MNTQVLLLEYFISHKYLFIYLALKFKNHEEIFATDIESNTEEVGMFETAAGNLNTERNIHVTCIQREGAQSSSRLQLPAHSKYETNRFFEEAKQEAFAQRKIIANEFVELEEAIAELRRILSEETDDIG